MNLKSVSVILCLILLCSINSAFAADNSVEAGYIVPIGHDSKIKENIAFYVSDFYHMDDALSTDRFQDWVKDNCATPDGCLFNLENPDVMPSSDKKIIMIYTNTEKMYLSISPMPEEQEPKERMLVASMASTPQNKFSIVNKCGTTVKSISLVFYKNYPIVKLPVPDAWSTRYNLGNGGVLNYNPDPGISYVTLGIRVTDKLLPDIFKLYVPLGDWHKAIIKKRNGKAYLDFN